MTPVTIELADNTGRVDTAGDEPAAYLKATGGSTTVRVPLTYEELLELDEDAQAVLLRFQARL